MNAEKTKKPKPVIEKITIHYQYGETKTIEKGVVAFFTETEKKKKVRLAFCNFNLLDAYPFINTVISLGMKLGIISKKREG